MLLFLSSFSEGKRGDSGREGLVVQHEPAPLFWLQPWLIPQANQVSGTW